MIALKVCSLFEACAIKMQIDYGTYRSRLSAWGTLPPAQLVPQRQLYLLFINMAEIPFATVVGVTIRRKKISYATALQSIAAAPHIFFYTKTKDHHVTAHCKLIFITLALAMKWQ